jgi:hypothetical protein
MDNENETGTAVAAAQVTNQVANTAPNMDPMAIWKSIEAMALNPDVDAAKIGALLNHQERIMDRAAQQAFTFAKNSAMSAMPKITKDSKIVHPGKNGGPDKLIGRYKKYEDLRKVIDPILTSYGLRITHDTGFSEAMKMPTVTAVLSFVKDNMSWTEIGGAMVIPFDATGAKSGAQGAGSSLTYGQRYTTCAILGIVIEGEDDDGNGGGARYIEKADWQEDLIDKGRKAALGGIDSYKAFFTDQTRNHRVYLIECGEHESLKKAAANHDKQNNDRK